MLTKFEIAAALFALLPLPACAEMRLRRPSA
jgi:hypothetical protein